jgi:hypothetical protein
MPNQDLAPVLFPRAGETLRLWPLVARPSWYRVHAAAGGLVLPCTGQHCPMGCSADCRYTLRCEGYALCCLAERPAALLVARLTPGLWDHSTVLSDPRTDCRQTEWVYCRLPGKGAPRWTLEVQSASDRPSPDWPEMFTSDHLWAWWPLPADQPDYRADVYALGEGEAAPGERPRPGRRKGVRP